MLGIITEASEASENPQKERSTERTPDPDILLTEKKEQQNS